MSAYGQVCPVSKAMELLDERWTTLVVRELTLGSRHYNELRRGVPRMSPALLSKRLRALARAGIVERRDDGPRVSYTLTEAGRELKPIVDALGRWGVRLCDFDPGHPEHATAEAGLRTLTMVWRGDLGWSEALCSGRIEVNGPGRARRAVPRWLGQSPMAAVPRPAATVP